MNRTGIGFDIHRLSSAGRSMTLAGVKIDTNFKVESVSDGDLIYHALADSLLTALGEDDIGHFFPPSKENEALKSSLIVDKAYQIMSSKGYAVENVSLIVVLNSPRLSSYAQRMKENIASLLSIGTEQVGISFKTFENIAQLGADKCIMCFCNSLLRKD